MAQTGYTPISIYYSATATNVPTAGNLVAGELAINTADGKLFYKDSSGVVQTIATKNGVAGGSTTQVQYNSSGSLAGSANMVFDGTTLTANALKSATVGSPSATALTLQSAGTTAVTVDTSQNVGIGTTSPNAKLQVANSTAGQTGFQVTSNGNAAVYIDYTGNGANYWQSSGTNFWTSVGGGTTRMSLDSSGNLAFNSGYGSAATAYGCRAWVKFTGSSGSISASGGVSSITRNSTGHYTVNLSFTMPDANYSVTAMPFNQSSGNGTRCIVGEGTPTTTSFQIFNMLFNGSQEDANTAVAVFR
jgi:hypothetical protein